MTRGSVVLMGSDSIVTGRYPQTCPSCQSGAPRLAGAEGGLRSSRRMMSAARDTLAGTAVWTTDAGLSTTSSGLVGQVCRDRREPVYAISCRSITRIG